MERKETGRRGGEGGNRVDGVKEAGRLQGFCEEKSWRGIRVMGAREAQGRHRFELTGSSLS